MGGMRARLVRPRHDEGSLPGGTATPGYESCPPAVALAKAGHSEARRFLPGRGICFSHPHPALTYQRAHLIVPSRVPELRLMVVAGSCSQNAGKNTAVIPRAVIWPEESLLVSCARSEISDLKSAIPLCALRIGFSRLGVSPLFTGVR